MRSDKKTMLISGLIGIGIGLLISGLFLSILLYSINSRDVSNITINEQLNKDDLKADPEIIEMKSEKLTVDLELEKTEPQKTNINIETENIKPEAKNTKPETENIKPKTENIKPEAENIKPEAQNIKPKTENIRSETVEVEIRRRATAKQIADLLEKEGVISDADEFVSYIISENATRILIRGRKTFKINSDYESALQVLIAR